MTPPAGMRRRKASIACALLLTAGCADQPKLLAAWYTIPFATPSTASDESAVQDANDGDYERVVLLNNGTDTVYIYAVTLNQKSTPGVQAQPSIFVSALGTPMRPGQMFELKTGLRISCQLVPVRLFVSGSRHAADAHPSRRWRVEITKPMPSALPGETVVGESIVGRVPPPASCPPVP